MTRFRVAAIAALSSSALLIATSGGEAQRSPGGREPAYRMVSTCKTAQKTERDFVKSKTTLQVLDRPGRREARAARFAPVKGAKIVSKLKDLTKADGNDVVDGKDTDKTNEDGVAKTKLEFDAFGNYRLITKAKVDGEVVDQDTIDFGVADRESGKCDAPVAQ